MGILHHVESEEPFTADINLRMAIVVRRSGLRDTPTREYRESLDILLWISPLQAHKRRYTCKETVLAKMDQLPLRPRHASVDSTLVRDTCPSTNGVINLPL